ncbi:lysis system i-spanin subunit Rz [Pseudomonas sp. G5(2012)]|uniref:lysis system i-spanin subunit Rz n=1 Tax=Pseudomonas sp. G5(2012) TaxID=1268068 RepID=UPI000343286E|nr:lysis system i-spanin subunit Rz [Pseudomonas sp. G5(2012)]EPA95457.1 Bacteriophage lysis protein [Pseudomonas sp. G5(2012)]
MRLIDLVPPALRRWAVALVLLAIAGAAAGGAWVAQDWRYGKELAEQAGKVDQVALKRAEDALAKLAIEQDKRAALERLLQANDATHYKELSDAKKTQQLLSDRLATADVRLSVLLTTGPLGGAGLSATASAGGVVHGPTRGQLDPAHAQRIIGITDAGDQGLIALAGCQAYAKEVSTPK